MTLVDSNVWLALVLSRHRFHAAAEDWFQSQGTGESLFCRSTQQSFLRLVTNKAIFAQYDIAPLTNKAAWSAYEGLLDDKRVAWVEEPKSLESAWRRFSSRSSASTKVWMDAYLAAFSTMGGHRFATTDQGFKQFKNLDLILIE
jgi:toxin-antitoxin system PIN domain toxin